MKDKIFEVLQRIGRSFMLPIAILPVAGLLLGLGSSFTNETTIATYHLGKILGDGTILHALLVIMNKVGSAVFDNLPLLFAVGVAIGMALSGNLQNFAGGLIILLFRPYKVGDFIEASTGASGTVKEIQIFHTILITADNKMIYVPNGAMSSGVITNYSKLDTRRIEWNFGVDYGEDYNKVEKVLREIIANDKRILTSPAPFIELGELAASSVNIKIRVWVNSSDYWNVFFSMNQTVYTIFNKEGINFPFPQLTVHQA